VRIVLASSIDPGFTPETILGYFESASLPTRAMGSIRVNLIASEPPKKSLAFFAFPFHPTALQRKVSHVNHAVRGRLVQWATSPEAKPDLDGAPLMPAFVTRDA
jgi:hypothetical protein